MKHTDQDRTLALSGAVQACYLVDQVARRGVADSAPMETTLGSLFQLNPQNVPDIYGGVDSILPGLRQLRELLRAPSRRDAQLTRYVLSVLLLERKLSKRPDLLAEIRERLERSAEQVEYFSLLDGNVLASLADIYVNTVSTLKPQILINGEATYLSNPENVNRIRALLLAGIRSAVLWRQCGGSRFQILLGRRKLLEETERLIASRLH